MPSPDVNALGKELATAAKGAAEHAAITTASSALATAGVLDWPAAWSAWQAARAKADLRDHLQAGLPDLPGLDALIGKVSWSDEAGLLEGLDGPIEIGPLHLQIASGSLVVTPPAGSELPPVVIGPYRPSRIAASIKPPFGDADTGLPGGGEVVRLPGDAGFGGTLKLPLGVVTVDAAAVLERSTGGAATFLAVLGISFLPPIQLSFGFSLDRVGGIIGVNRTVDTDALTQAVRSGQAGDALFAVRPPASPGAVIDEVRRFFPARDGHFVIGPTVKVSWLSFGPEGSFISLDLGVAVEIPTGTIVIVGVAQAQIPDLPQILHLRIDVVGIIDTHDSTISIDASLVDSHVLGIFAVHGDGALRLNWGRDGYMLASVGGFYPGFDPSPVRVPPLRRVGLSPDVSLPGGLDISGEGYFAVTTNTVQLGGRIDVSLGLGITAHGFIAVDALVQFRPFFFTASVSAGFDVRFLGHTFGGVRLDGTISGPDPVTISGSLKIETFLGDLSWHKTFTIGDGPSDTCPSIDLLEALRPEIARTGNLRAAADSDSSVLLSPRPVPSGTVALPANGSLRWSQRRAPLGFPLDRVDGQPLGARQGAELEQVATPVEERFSPGTYCAMTEAQALHRPAFDVHDAGGVLTGPTPAAAPFENDDRPVDLIVILGQDPFPRGLSTYIDISGAAGLVTAARRAPALSDATPLVTAGREQWKVVGDGTNRVLSSATAAHQFAAVNAGAFAVAAHDAAAPVDLTGV